MTIKDLKDLDRFLCEIRNESEVKTKRFSESIRLQLIIVHELKEAIKALK